MTIAPNSETAAIEAASQLPRTAMNFPGTNSLSLSEDAVAEALRSVLSARIGARIISIEWQGYTSRTLDITFTTDPEPKTPAA